MKTLVFSLTHFTSILLLCCIALTVQAKNAEFPGRDIYPTIPFIEIDDLHAIKDKTVIVDVRSAYEHKTLRIKGALNIPLASPSYAEKIRAVRNQNGGKKIVVYCNGKTCMKSYKAVLKCKRHGVKDVVAYDAGIMDWAKKFPAEAVLLGESPVDPNKIISKKDFKKLLITPEEFEKKLGEGNVLVLDVRDRFQRDATGLFVGKENRVYINDATGLDKYIAQANKEGKTLLIYDEVGKQVRWLQYYLERKNAKSYYFMKNGVKGYYKYLDSKYQ